MNKDQIMKKHFLMPLALLTAVIALTGCRTDGYYQDQAVHNAREFLLEEAPAMPLMEQEYIKFNRPFMLVSHINGNNYSTGQMQICICWMTPGNPELYMVYGTSGLRMMDWKPLRMLMKLLCWLTTIAVPSIFKGRSLCMNPLPRTVSAT